MPPSTSSIGEHTAYTHACQACMQLRRTPPASQPRPETTRQKEQQHKRAHASRVVQCFVIFMRELPPRSIRSDFDRCAGVCVCSCWRVYALHACVPGCQYYLYTISYGPPRAPPQLRKTTSSSSLSSSCGACVPHLIGEICRHVLHVHPRLSHKNKRAYRFVRRPVKVGHC